jgi:hypothetical protein
MIEISDIAGHEAAQRRLVSLTERRGLRKRGGESEGYREIARRKAPPANKARSHQKPTSRMGSKG